MTVEQLAEGAAVAGDVDGEQLGVTAAQPCIATDAQPPDSNQSAGPAALHSAVWV